MLHAVHAGSLGCRLLVCSQLHSSSVVFQIRISCTCLNNTYFETFFFLSFLFDILYQGSRFQGFIEVQGFIELLNKNML